MTSEDCTRAQALLLARIDEPLDPGREESLVKHLSACGSCRDEDVLLRGTAELMASWAFFPQLDQSFFERQRSAIRERLAPLDAWSAPRWSLVLVFSAVGLCLWAGMPALMASVNEFVLTLAELSFVDWTGMDGVILLYALLMLLAASRVQPEPQEQEVGI